MLFIDYSYGIDTIDLKILMYSENMVCEDFLNIDYMLPLELWYL